METENNPQVFVILPALNYFSYRYYNCAQIIFELIIEFSILV